MQDLSCSGNFAISFNRFIIVGSSKSYVSAESGGGFMRLASCAHAVTKSATLVPNTFKTYNITARNYIKYNDAIRLYIYSIINDMMIFLSSSPCNILYKILLKFSKPSIINSGIRLVYFRIFI